MSNNKIYCGIKKCPKNKKVGTMLECAKCNQIRRYGINKIDSKVFQASKQSISVEQDRKSLIVKMSSLRGKIKKLTTDILYEKNPDHKEKLKIQLKMAKEDLLIASQAFSKLEQKLKK